MFSRIKNNHRLEIFTVFIIAIIVMGFFFRLFYPVQSIFVTPDYGQSDLFQLNYPAKFSLHQALQNNEFPLWNTYIGTGFPQLAEGQIGTFNVVNMIMYKFLPFVTAVNLGYISIFLTSAIGTFIYLKFLRFRTIVAFTGSVLFAFSGFFVTHMSHINLIQSSSYLPWLFFLMHAYVKNRNLLYALLFTLILSQQFFSGFPQITFISLCGVLLLYLINIRSQSRKISTYTVPILMGVLFIALIAVQLLPSRELLELSTRKDGFLQSQATQYSFPFKHFIGFINPHIFGTPENGTYPVFTRFDYSIYWENTGYIGLIPLLLVALILFKKKKSKDQKFYLLLLFVSALLMTGKHSPLYFIYSFPPFDMFRVPSRFILLFVWALVVLSAYGFEYICAVINKRVAFIWVRQIIVGLLVICSLGQLLMFSYAYNPIGSSNEWFREPEIVRNVAKDNRYYTVGSGILWNEHFIKKGWTDPLPFLSLQNYLEPNLNILHKVSSFEVYPILTTNRYAIMASLLEKNVNLEKDLSSFDVSPAGNKLLAMNNIGTIVSAYPSEALKNSASINVTGGEIRSYSLEKPLPRARFVYAYDIINTAEDFSEKISLVDFEPTDTALLEVKPEKYVSKNNVPDEGAIDIVDMTNRELILTTRNKNDGILVVSDLYYPGWKATIDGNPTEILAANVAQRALIVPKGDHKITFQYEPSSVYIGSVVTIFSHILLFILIFAGFFSSKYRRYLSIR